MITRCGCCWREITQFWHSNFQYQKLFGLQQANDLKRKWVCQKANARHTYDRESPKWTAILMVVLKCNVR